MNMPELDSNKEEYDYSREPEPDRHTKDMHSNRSRYFFATISFLVALLFLSAYLNNHFDLASGWLLLLGVLGFGAVGLLFLSRNSIVNRATNSRTDYKDSNKEIALMEEDEEASVQEDENTGRDELSPFEQLIEEALASIPGEFHERMENVLVRVQYEPGPEGLKRIATATPTACANRYATLSCTKLRIILASITRRCRSGFAKKNVSTTRLKF